MSVQPNIGEIFQHVSDKIAEETNALEKACKMRQQSFILLQETLRVGDEAATGLVVDEHLKRYMRHVSQISQNSVNNYTAQVAELLKTRDKCVDLSKWNTSLECRNDVSHSPCQGQFMDCSAVEISNTDLLDEDISGTVHIRKMDRGWAEDQIGARVDVKSDELGSPENTDCLKNSISGLTSPSRYDHIENRVPPTVFLHNTSSRLPNATVECPKSSDQDEPASSFRTARDELQVQNLKKYGNTCSNNQQPLFAYGTSKKSLGARRSVKTAFIPPVKQDTSDKQNYQELKMEEPIDERLKNIDPIMVELISSEIMHKFKPVDWSDIAGLEYAKSTIQEAVVWPLLRPDIFRGLRRPPRGILLFGPPGTGKTLIGKCIASQSKSTFFSISASSLTSKWIGEGEKMVRALFAVAAVHQPAVIFIDEIDSLLCQRSETEHESSRRIKTEFLIQLDGAATSEDDRILIVGATNRPQELDEAARRRLVRRLYIPLPELAAREQILRNLLQSVKNNISAQDIHEIGKLTEGYSGADMECLCREASMEPIRSIPPHEIPFFNESEVRDICFEDFRAALTRVKASVSQNDLQQYTDWNRTYGSGSTR